jgi:hypothetical protein
MAAKASEIISKSTRASTRNIWIAIFALFILKRYGVAQSWPMDLSAVPVGGFDEFYFILLAALTVNHLVHWVVDFKIYQNWFLVSEVPKGSFDLVTDIEDKLPVLEGLRERIQLFKQVTNGGFSGDPLRSDNEEKINESIKSLEFEIKRLIDHQNQILFVTQQLHDKFRKTNATVKFFVFFWHLGIPLLVVISALVLILCGVSIAK